MRPRIGLLLQGSESWMGGIIYIQNLVKAISGLPGGEREAFELVLLRDARLATNLGAGLQGSVDELVTVNPGPLRRAGNRIRRRIGRRFAALSDSTYCDLLAQHRLDFIYPMPCLPGLRLPPGNRWACWIPDFQHKHLPEFFQPGEIAHRDRSFQYIASHAESVVVSSAVAQRDFVHFCPGARATPIVLRFRTILEPSWFQADPKPIVAKFGLPNRFFLVCNQFFRHKNHGVVAEALRLLPDDITVVCTGAVTDYRSRGYPASLLEDVARWGLSRRFLTVGLIAREEQVQLMRACVAIIQPSLFEGWSTVVEDARALGTPIILSNLDVHREQDPPGAAYFDPLNAGELALRMSNTTAVERKAPDYLQEANTRAAIEYARQFLCMALANRA